MKERQSNGKDKRRASEDDPGTGRNEQEVGRTYRDAERECLILKGGIILHNKLASAFRIWANVLLRPGEQVFAAERKKEATTLSTALWWILLINAVTIPLVLLNMTLINEWLPYRAIQDLSGLPEWFIRIFRVLHDFKIARVQFHFNVEYFFGKLWINSGLYELIGHPLIIASYYYSSELPSWFHVIIKIIPKPAIFLVKASAYNYLAILLGGRGQLGRYAYLLAAITVPIAALHLINDFMPLVGGKAATILIKSTGMTDYDWYYLIVFHAQIISFCLIIYWCILFYFVTKVEHEMSWGRAIIATLGSYLIGFVLNAAPFYLRTGLLEAWRAFYY